MSDTGQGTTERDHGRAADTHPHQGHDEPTHAHNGEDHARTHDGHGDHDGLILFKAQDWS